jgi:hypothetical protein
MSIPPYDPVPPPSGRRPLTNAEVGLILGVVALVVLCCLGVAALSVFVPAPS